MENLKIKINPGKIVIDGPLDENATQPLNELLSKLSSQATLNMSGVSRVNSVGISVWLDFTRQASQKCKLILELCSPDFVHQMNMISSFRENVTISSCQRYFSCLACNSSGIKDFIRSVHYNETGVLLANNTCTTCGEIVEFEESDNEYFHFAF